MKTMKEFPATHSMSTEWFVVDEEGNIALFDFDENGPVPVDIPVESSSCLMTSEEDFGEKDSDEIEYLELTDEQVEEPAELAVCHHLQPLRPVVRRRQRQGSVAVFDHVSEVLHAEIEAAL